ncbi:CGNR zinc finger domain-containing protein [Microlunatus parietis]
MADLDTRIEALGPSFGGALCLDFANSVEPRGATAQPDQAGTPRLRQDFNDPYDLVAWGLNQQLYGHDRAKRLWRVAGEAEAAGEVLHRTRKLSDVTYRVFAALAGGAPPSPGDVAALQAAYGEAVRNGTLAITSTGPVFNWPEPDLRVVRWAAAVSAFDTLRSVAPTKIKICGGEGRDGIPCGWLFIDTTKNGSRRWCSMSDCGNTNKSRRQNARRRTERASRSGRSRATRR